MENTTLPPMHINLDTSVCQSKLCLSKQGINYLSVYMFTFVRDVTLVLLVVLNSLMNT